MFYKDFQLLRKVSNSGENALRQIRKTFRERNRFRCNTSHWNNNITVYYICAR